MRRVLGTKDFVLGTFATNCSGDMTPTKLPNRWAATFENNERLAVMLDEAGIDGCDSTLWGVGCRFGNRGSSDRWRR
jgi:hypothetical protein